MYFPTARLRNRPEVWVTFALALSPLAAQACTHGGFNLPGFGIHLPLGGSVPATFLLDRGIDRVPLSAGPREPIAPQPNPFPVCIHCDTDHGVVPSTIIPVGERLDLTVGSAADASSNPWACMPEGPSCLYHLDAVCAIEHPPR